jgi:hypothetical protein
MTANTTVIVENNRGQPQHRFTPQERESSRALPAAAGTPPWPDLPPPAADAPEARRQPVMILFPAPETLASPRQGCAASRKAATTGATGSRDPTWA